MVITSYRAGFVHIVGPPNAGKSTLTNALVKHPLSAVTHKPQTTQCNIMGVDQGEHHQVIYVDTPGYLDPACALQEMMMKNVHQAFIGQDILIFLVDVRRVAAPPNSLTKYITKASIPIFLLLNKVDLLTCEQVGAYVEQWKQKVPCVSQIIPISATNPRHVASFSQKVINTLPVHPPYYDKDALTDRSVRTLSADILRKSLLMHFRQEVPYSTAIVVDQFEERNKSIFIKVMFYVERESQKHILIGKKGEAIKRLGVDARRTLEIFLKKKVYLEQHVKVLRNWRNNKKFLLTLGHW